jgi:hypothetical protein
VPREVPRVLAHVRHDALRFVHARPLHPVRQPVSAKGGAGLSCPGSVTI